MAKRKTKTSKLPAGLTLKKVEKVKKGDMLVTLTTDTPPKKSECLTVIKVIKHPTEFVRSLELDNGDTWEDWDNEDRVYVTKKRF
jgi:hypothetical protein